MNNLSKGLTAKLFLLAALLYCLLPGTAHAAEDRDSGLEIYSQLEKKYTEKIEHFLTSLYGGEKPFSVEILLQSPGEQKPDLADRDSYTLSITVFIDGTWEFLLDKNRRFIVNGEGMRERSFRPIAPEELESVRRAVKQIVAFSEQRGDSLLIESVRFNRREYFEASDKEWRSTAKRRSGMLTFLLAAFFCVVIFIVYRVVSKDIEYRKKIREDELERDFILKAGRRNRDRS